MSVFTVIFSLCSSGDKNIVYLDGVQPNLSPPTTSVVRTNGYPPMVGNGRSPVTKTLSYPLTKAGNRSEFHQQLLQTIREDDSESR